VNFQTDVITIMTIVIYNTIMSIVAVFVGVFYKLYYYLRPTLGPPTLIILSEPERTLSSLNCCWDL